MGWISGGEFLIGSNSHYEEEAPAHGVRVDCFYRPPHCHLVLAGGTTVDVFAEPQWTLAHEGARQPKFQVVAGVNLQFPIAK